MLYVYFCPFGGKVDAADSKSVILGYEGSSPSTGKCRGSLVGKMLYCDYKDMGSIPIPYLKILLSLIGRALVFEAMSCGFKSCRRQRVSGREVDCISLEN